jgi:predicted nucleic acid-binding protein
VVEVKMAIRKVSYVVAIQVLTEGKKVIARANSKFARVQQVVDLLKKFGFTHSTVQLVEQDLNEERSVGLHNDIYEVDIETISSK